ncbi:MAG: peroxidase family protein, partial [Verrucomicrobiota bacterium]
MKTQSQWTVTLLSIGAVVVFGPDFAEAQNNNRGNTPEPAPVPRRMKSDRDPNRQRDDENESERRSLNSFTQQFPDEYRTIDGFGNNIANPLWGAAEIPFLRLTSVDYADGLSEPSGETRPNPREISNAVSAQSHLMFNRRRATDFVWQ